MSSQKVELGLEGGKRPFRLDPSLMSRSLSRNHAKPQEGAHEGIKPDELASLIMQLRRVGDRKQCSQKTLISSFILVEEVPTGVCVIGRHLLR